MFFRLNPEARLIPGAKNGVIYDFLGNKMYDLSPEEKFIMELAEKSKEIEEISKDLGIPEASVIKVFNKFKEKNLGEFYEKKPYIEPLRLKSPLSSRAFYDFFPQLTNFFVELNNSCQYDCGYCGSKKKRVFGCIGCNVWDHKGALDTDSLKGVLDQVYKLGVGQIFLTGGNVLKDLHLLSAVLDHCEVLHFPIFLTCHENYVNSDAVNFLNGYKWLNIFLNCNFPVSSKALEIAGNVQCNLTLVPVVDVTNMGKEEVIEKIQHEYEKVQRRRVSWQIDYCSADFRKDYSKISLFGKERTRNATLQFFERCQEYHPCLGGILTISSDGYVYVCRTMREKSLGNVLDTNLSEIIRNRKEEIEKFWNVTRDNIAPCRDCEYRYSCMECRAIEKDVYQTNLCHYNPHAGEWE